MSSRMLITSCKRRGLPCQRGQESQAPVAFKEASASRRPSLPEIPSKRPVPQAWTPLNPCPIPSLVYHLDHLGFLPLPVMTPAHRPVGFHYPTFIMCCCVRDQATPNMSYRSPALPDVIQGTRQSGLQETGCMCVNIHVTNGLWLQALCCDCSCCQGASCRMHLLLLSAGLWTSLQRS